MTDIPGITIHPPAPHHELTKAEQILVGDLRGLIAILHRRLSGDELGEIDWAVIQGDLLMALEWVEELE